MKKPFGAIGPRMALGALLISGTVLADTYQMVVPVKGLSVADVVEAAPAGATSIECGGYHCYALVSGTVYSVGHNGYGQLGRAGTTDQSSWGATSLTGVDALAAGGWHGYALKGGTVYSVGRNNFGQLGRGGTTSTWGATTLTGVSALAAGDSHGYALKDGTVYSVGRNDKGQLGRAGTTNQSSWGASKDAGGNDLTGVDAISAGYYHGYALRGGTVWSVGLNAQGQLGRGGTTSTWYATTLTGVDVLAAGSWHGYALKGGTVYSVGYNRYGQLGRAGTTNQSTWGATTPVSYTHLTLPTICSV